MRLSDCRKLGIFFGLMMTLASCTYIPNLFKDSTKSGKRQAKAPTDQDKTVILSNQSHDAGITTATLDATSSLRQQITVTESELAGSSIEFPPGSLAVSADITIQASAPLATSGTAAELGVAGNFVQTGPAVLVTSSVAQDAIVPFTMTIPLQGTSSLRISADIRDENLVVLYKVKGESDQQTVSGIIPRSSIIVRNDFAEFTASRFGSYQAVYLSQPVENPIEVVTATSIISQAEVKQLPALQVQSRRPFLVKPGETVEIHGINFRSSLLLALNGLKVSSQVKSDSLATFIAPASGSYGLLQLLAEQDGSSQTISLFYAGANTDFPIATLPPQEICSGTKFYDKNGDLQTGTKGCDGPVLSGLTPQVLKAGITVAGVTGTAVLESHNSCSTDGGIDCVTTSTYAAALTTGLAGKVVSGNTVAGITGTASTSEAHVNCTAANQTGCVATSIFKTMDTSTAGASTGITAANFNTTIKNAGNFEFWDGTGLKHTVAGDADLTATNIVNGVNIFGVIGSVSVESHANCSADAEVGCVVVGPAFKAADMSFATAGNIKSGAVIAGVSGSVTQESHTSCVSDGAIGCATTAGFPAADASLAVAGNIRSGVTLAGISGNYPSAASPLVGSDPTADLDLASFDAKIKSPGTFEWFDSNGNRYVNMGDADITAGNIISGITIFGTTGTAITGSYCSADGQATCFVNNNFKAADTTTYSPWDIRKGKTVGGVVGNISFYKNMANTAYFNRTTGTGASASIDSYDTIDDFNNAGAFPTQNNVGWDQATGVNWILDPANDTGVGGGVAADGICNGTEACVYKDQITGLIWARGDATLRNWETAITYCEGLTSGGYTDWRLPTQKELLQGYTDGIWSQNTPTKLNLSANYFWTATTSASTTTFAWVTYLDDGSMATVTKTNTYQSICIR